MLLFYAEVPFSAFGAAFREMSGYVSAGQRWILPEFEKEQSLGVSLTASPSQTMIDGMRAIA